jgi:RimJ/RimL family protein N-acetyltransferase
MIRGRSVALRPAAPADRRTVWSWAVAPDVAPNLFRHEPVPTFEAFSADTKRHYFDASDPRRGQSFLIRAHGEELGQISSNDIDARRGRTELDIWLAGEAACNRGVGPAAIETLADHLCREYGVVEFMMQPSSNNPRAIRAYEKAGFRPLGLPLEQALAEWGPADGPDAFYMVLRMPALVRPGTPADLPFLRAMLYEAAYWSPDAPRPPLDEGLAPQELARLLREFGSRPGDAALVAESPDGRPLGAAWFRLWTRDEHSYGFVDERIPELAIAVVAEARGRGIGAQLLRSLVLEAGREGCNALSLSVAHGNPARRLYEALGFCEHGCDAGAATLCLELAR